MTDTIVKPLDRVEIAEAEADKLLSCAVTLEMGLKALLIKASEIANRTATDHPQWPDLSDALVEASEALHEGTSYSRETLDLSSYRAQIRAEALEEAAQVAETAPYKRGAMVCGCSEGLSNYTAASIRTLIEKGAE